MSKYQFSGNRALAVLGTSLLALPCVNVAAKEGLALEEVIVTATRRAESLQTVPVTVSAMTGNELQSKGVFDTNDLMGQIPNLQINSPWGDSQPNFNLRGVGVGNEFNANIASPIGVYFDEVYEGFRAAHGAQIFDVERIEVVKGPQGTLYGRNTTGGAINIISRTPDLDGSNGFLTMGYGNYNRKRIQAAAETTLIDDKLGVRIAGTWVKGDGYIKNRNSDYGVSNTLVGDKDFASEDSRALRVTFRAMPTDNLNLTLKAYTGESKPIGAAPIPVFVDNPLLPANGFNRDSALDDDEAVSFRGGRFYNDTDGVAFTVNWEINDELTLISTSAYSKNKQDLSIDFGGSTQTTQTLAPGSDVADIGYSHYVSENEAINQDIRLNYQSGDLQLIVGAYYGWDEVDTDNRVTFSGYLDAGIPAGSFNPLGLYTGLVPFPPSSFDALQAFVQERKSTAFYIEGTYDFTDKLSLTLGARYTEDESSLDDFYALYLDSTDNPAAYAYSSEINPSPAPGLFPFDPNTAYLPKLDDKEDNWTGRVIVDYAITSDVMIYASYSKGYRAGAYNGLAIAGPEQIYITDPEKLDAYEVGIKSRLLDDRLQLNGAVFYYDYTGQQLQESVGATTFLRNLDSTVLGLEAEITYQATDRLRLTSGFGFLDTEYDDGQVLSGIDISGNEQPFAPDITFNLSADYLLAEVADGEVTVSGDIQYKGEQWYDPFNSKQAAGPIKDGIDSFWLSNIRVSYESDDLLAALYVKNITDKYYEVYGINTEGFASNNYLIRGEPRTYGVEVTFKF